VQKGRVELAATMDSEPTYLTAPVQQQGNGYPNQYKAYQAPPPQPLVQQNGNGVVHEITPQASGYGPGGMYSVEMDGNSEKATGKS
jgi:hypothetical protein